MSEFVIGTVLGAIVGVVTIAALAVHSYDKGYSDGVIDAQKAAAMSEENHRALASTR